MLPTPHQQILACLQQLALLQLMLMNMAERESASLTTTTDASLSTGATQAFPPPSCSCGPHCPRYPCWIE